MQWLCEIRKYLENGEKGKNVESKLLWEMANSWRNIFIFSCSPIFTFGKKIQSVSQWGSLQEVQLISEIWRFCFSLCCKKGFFCALRLNSVSVDFHLDCRIHKYFCNVLKVRWKFSWIWRIWCIFAFIKVFLEE